LAEDYDGRVVFVGVSNNDTVEDGKAYVDEFGVPYAMAHAPEVWDLYDVPYQPVTVVIDGDGAMATRVDGPISYEGLNQIIKQVV
jgi:hypothetical protein